METKTQDNGDEFYNTIHKLIDLYKKRNPVTQGNSFLILYRKFQPFKCLKQLYSFTARKI